ncbi:MAG: glycosyltransferase family 39 protein [Actinomycetota bacterium]|nr:glycosyltransferase family 39 protein [Actinomycetota bacterium]
MHLGYQGDATPGHLDDENGTEVDRRTTPEADLSGSAEHARPGLRAGRGGVSVWQVLVATVVVIGVVVRFTADSHLWLDEALSVNIARLPLARLPEALRHDGAPPLYYLLLHWWMGVFGTGTIAVRALSGVFAVAALPLMWIVGRRLGGKRLAVATLVIGAVSPFAVRYGTEARMYSLLTLLVLFAWLALSDLLERFAWSRAIAVSVLTGLLLLTHYWSFYLLAVTGAFVAHRAIRGPGRGEARRAALAIGVGCLAFLPWLPSFAFQLSHTGTPWAGRPDVRILFDTVFQFTGGFWDPGFIFGILAWLLIVVALLGRSIDGTRIELDLRTRPESRFLAIIGFGTLAVAFLVGVVTQSGFAVRYAAVLFPFVLALIALGTTRFTDPRVFRGVLATCVVLSLIAISPNVFGDRTTAAKVARLLRTQARPGDVVAYCPDQLAPSVSRLLGDPGLVQIPFPLGGSPERVDWVDYAQRNHAAATAPFTQMLLDRAGPDHDIWLVWSPNYLTFGTKCTALGDRLQAARPDMKRLLTIKTDYFEHPGLIRYRPR